MSWIIDLIGLLVFGAFAVLGRFVYLHPERSLEKFNPYGKPYGKCFVRQVQVFGAFMLVLSLYVFLARLFTPLARKMPTPVFIAIFLALAGMISWRLLKRPKTTT